MSRTLDKVIVSWYNLATNRLKRMETKMEVYLSAQAGYEVEDRGKTHYVRMMRDGAALCSCNRHSGKGCGHVEAVEQWLSPSVTPMYHTPTPEEYIAISTNGTGKFWCQRRLMTGKPLDTDDHLGGIKKVVGFTAARIALTLKRQGYTIPIFFKSQGKWLLV